MKKLALLLCLVLMASIFMPACNSKEEETPPTNNSDTQQPSSPEGDPDTNPADQEDPNPQGLSFSLLPDGTYTVSVGEAFYLEEITIPSTYNGKKVTAIAEGSTFNAGGTFSFMPNLKKLVISDGITTICQAAFYSCSKLESISIPNSITFIGAYAFMYCNNAAYTAHENGKYLGNAENPYLLLTEIDNTGAPSFTFQNTTKFIHCYAFAGCSALTSVSLPQNLESIGYCAFQRCSNLVSIEIPNKVTYISRWAIMDCDLLSNVDFATCEGWKIDNNSVNATDLADNAIAANYLKETYATCTWTRLQ